MKQAILRKANESARVLMAFFETHAEAIEDCARAMAARFQRSGWLWTIGNGGSACDAEHLAVEFRHPIIEKRRALPALALTSDTAGITAIGNDTDFSRCFTEPLDLLARPDDMVLGISSSGSSANVNRALRRGQEKRLLTIGFAGRDGGAMHDLCDHCFVVNSWSIHRIQETHTALLHLLWDAIHLELGEDDVL